MNPVNWFEIPVSDVDRAKSFYEKVFDFEMKKMEMPDRTMVWFPSDMNSYGASGSLVKEKTYVPSHSGSVVYFSVKDIDAVLNKVNARKCRILVPKTDIGEYGIVAYFEDSEGNRVGLHSMK
jgi:hypothetical protein